MMLTLLLVDVADNHAELVEFQGRYATATDSDSCTALKAQNSEYVCI